MSSPLPSLRIVPTCRAPTMPRASSSGRPFCSLHACVLQVPWHDHRLELSWAKGYPSEGRQRAFRRSDEASRVKVDCGGPWRSWQRRAPSGYPRSRRPYAASHAGGHTPHADGAVDRRLGKCYVIAGLCRARVLDIVSLGSGLTIVLMIPDDMCTKFTTNLMVGSAPHALHQTRWCARTWRCDSTGSQQHVMS